MDESTPSQPSPQDVNDILKRKRKVREHKACYPCRKRKVRCDSQVPCKTCIERNHADLCTFNPPNKRRESNASRPDDGSLDSSTIHKDDWERVTAKINGMEKAMADLKDELRRMNGMPKVEPNSPPLSLTHRDDDALPNGPSYVKAMEINEANHLTGEPINLGGGSIPALVSAFAKGNDYSTKVKQVFGNNALLPIFGLDNESTTYPFVSLWGYQEASTRVAELRKVLPSDAECLETFRQYRDGGNVTFPCISTIETFETDLLGFLTNRRVNDTNMTSQITNETMDGMHIRWIALLFAVFASGVQFSPLPKRDRELLSQVYACCSFECLRIINYLSNASIEAVQTLLILGNMLSNAMNAGAAWVLLGMTLRLARTLGCHTAPERATKSAADLNASRTWWAVLWQDSLLSISYDRATSTATPDTAYPPPELPTGQGLTFRECMHRIAKVGLLTVNNRTAPQTIQARLNRCVDLREDIARTREAAAPHLRDERACRSIQDQCEFWTLYLHASYMTSELCRPAISPGTAEFDSNGDLRRLCIKNLVNTVEAFTGLANNSPIHTRSWAGVHRALSAALLLGILGEPLRSQRTYELLRRLMVIMHDGAGPGQQVEELSAPVARSISALNKLTAPESITPRAMEEVQATIGQVPQQQQQQQQNPPAQGMLGGTTVDGKSSAADFAGMSAANSGSSNHQVHHPNSNNTTNNGTGVPGANGVSHTSAPTAAGTNANSATLDFDDSAFFLPTPLAGFEDESSPYALMDSIIWGGGGGGGGGTGTAGKGVM